MFGYKKKCKELEERVKKLELNVFGETEIPNKVYQTEEKEKQKDYAEKQIKELREAFKDVPPSPKKGDIITYDDIRESFDIINQYSQRIFLTKDK